MSKLMALTRRDLELLLALTQKVRLFSFRQVAEHWWGGELANARRRLRLLTEAGLLVRMRVVSRTLPLLFAPHFVWRPGDNAPNFGAISFQLKSRWKDQAARQMTAYVASEQAGRLLGGKARGDLKNGLQATHDLGVAAVWLRLRSEFSPWTDMWRGEDLLAATRRGQKIPDAFIVDSRGQVQQVIEFGGAYDADRVEAFHSDCAQRSLPYEIW